MTDNIQAVIDLLVDARDVLFERGHCKRILEDREGHVCAVGAVNVATTGHTSWSLLSDAMAPVHSSAIAALDAAAGDLYPERMPCRGPCCIDVVPFNNHPDTTPGEVIDVFDHAIAREKEKLL